jgi:hypothetical protein
MLVAALLALLPVLPAAPADTLVVCPQAYRSALEPWLALRRNQGHALELLEPAGSSEALERQIRSHATAHVRQVVLVGDVASPQLPESPSVPTCLRQAEVNVRFGSEPEIASDQPLADFDGDGAPEVAIGRLSVSSAAELERLVAKIIHYERAAGFGAWRRRIDIVAGAGGFGAFTDTVLEVTTRKLVVDGIPQAYHTNFTYGSWTSPYCPDPRRLRETAQRGLGEGCLFWAYLGHGQRRHVDRPRLLGRPWPVLEAGDAARLRAPAGTPIALLLSCYAGAYDGPEDCLAEELLRAEGGPVAVLCGSRVTMPYGMTALAQELLDQAFRGERQTLGELIQRAKRDLLARAKQSPTRQTVDLLASALNPADLAQERREHALLFNLLGDPLLTLHAPAPVELTVAATAERGGRLEVVGKCSVEGPCVAELVSPRDRAPPLSRGALEPATASDLTARQDLYERANDPRLATADARVVDGRVSCWLDVPENAPDDCHVRLFVQGARAHAVGAARVKIAWPAASLRVSARPNASPR